MACSEMNEKAYSIVCFSRVSDNRIAKTLRHSKALEVNAIDTADTVENGMRRCVCSFLACGKGSKTVNRRRDQQHKQEPQLYGIKRNERRHLCLFFPL